MYCCNNSGYFINPINRCCSYPYDYTCYYTPNCGCSGGNSLFGFGGGCGSSLALIALFALLCR